MECLGCRIANGLEPNLNIVYENELVTCVLDIDPFNEGHTLILPKKHCLDLDEMDTEVAHAIMDASRMLVQTLKTIFQPNGIRVCQDGGDFNDLNHYHMHVIPRYAGDHFVWGEPAQPNDAAQRLGQTKEKILHLLPDRT
ncbi:HIT family protein [Saccharibacillus sacchari]|uniref:HIT family protein n=1 Tax=Saccharibacillus sacchari TaxID=456493 RepID=A0ACC6P728_9BACL